MLRKGHGDLYKAPTKEESKRLRGERDQIKFIDLRFERWQVVRFRKARRRQEVPQIARPMDDDLWDRVREVGSVMIIIIVYNNDGNNDNENSND